MKEQEVKIQTLNPDRKKKGVNISRAKYDPMKKAILGSLDSGTLTHAELNKKVQKKLEGKFEGALAWYMETVKLDLEARNLIERTDSKPQRYRIKAG